jgi:hypothetical protein
MNIDERIRIVNEDVQRIEQEVKALKAKRNSLYSVRHNLTEEKFTMCYTEQEMLDRHKELVNTLKQQTDLHIRGKLSLIDGVLYIKLRKPDEHYGLERSPDGDLFEHGICQMAQSRPDHWLVRWSVYCVIPKEAVDPTATMFPFFDLEKFIQFKFMFADYMAPSSDKPTWYVSASEQA